VQYIEIQVKGHIDNKWSASFGELTTYHTKNGNTTIKGSVRDQATLYGLLSYLSNLGIKLISVSSLDENQIG